MKKLFAPILSALVLGALACSSSSSSPGGTTSLDPHDLDPFAAKYCIGTLKTTQSLMHSTGPGAWEGTGSPTVGAGTQFLVAADFGQWQGYVIDDSGVAEKIDADFEKGLVRDTDFTADCATDAALSQSNEALLEKATFYPKVDLSGTPCTIDGVTQLTQYSIATSGAIATVSAAEIKAQCGLDTAYSKDLVYAPLVTK